MLAVGGLSLSSSLFGANLWAQDYDSTQPQLLTGRVLVEPGNQIPPGRALVILYSSLNQLLSQTTTTGSGGFSFERVPAGNYKVVARLAGYQEAIADVEIYPHATRTQVMPIVLKPITRSEEQPSQAIVSAAELALGKEARAQYRRAVRALEKGRAEGARGHLKRTVQLAPTFAGGYYLLGVAADLLGDYPGAEAAFGQAVRLEPGRPDAYFGLAKTLNLLSRPREALEAVNKGLGLSPNSTLGMFEKSKAQLSLGDFASAEATVQQSLKEFDQPPAAIHLVLANCYLSTHRYADAATELQVYLQLEPKGASVTKAQEVLAKLKAAGIMPSSPAPLKGHP